MQPYAMSCSTSMSMIATKLDSRPKSRYHSSPATNSIYRPIEDEFVTYSSGIPIRTSQVSRRTVASSYPPRSDSHLRRKTPNGIIDAAYDGSSLQSFMGQPPMKQMILSTQNTPQYSLPVAPRPLSQALASVPASSVDLDVNRISQGHVTRFINDKTHPKISQHQCSSAGSHPCTPPAFGGICAFVNNDQPVLQACESNARTIFQPLTSFCGPSVDRGGYRQPERLSWTQPYDLCSISPAPHHDAIPRHMVQNGLSAFEFVDSLNLAQASPIDSSNLSSYAMRRPHLDPVHYSQPSFRQKALCQAHQVYRLLLAHTRICRRPSHSKGSCPSEQFSSQQFGYPKPPSPFSLPPLRSGGDNAPTQSLLVAEHTDNLPRILNNSTFPNTVSASANNGNQFYQNNINGAQTKGPNVISGYPGQTLVSDSSMHPLARAKFSLEILNSLCGQSDWKWIDGMLLGGCLHYGLENYRIALQWFERITILDPSHIVAISNTAATLYSLERRDEAEQHWLRALKLRPSYLDTAEHLVGLLYRKRSDEAVGIIDYVQNALRLSSLSAFMASTSGDMPPYSAHVTSGLDRVSNHSTEFPTDVINTGWTEGTKGFQLPNDVPGVDGFGTSGYALSGSENGRILALVHAKGTILYALKDVYRASKSFEEAVMISVGRHIHGIRHLIRLVQAVLSPPQPTGTHQTTFPLLLHPDKARQTARLVFSANGELPGLSFVSEGAPKRGATRATSNALLSLAKIFQDNISTGTGHCLSQDSAGVGDILALYYLSLSLQESPSTANNVGILLAGIQQGMPSVETPLNEAVSQPLLLGAPPGSGLALAMAYYQYGLRLDPYHVHLHTNMGSLLKDIGQLDLAIYMYEQAVSCDGNFDIALTNLANAVKDRGRLSDAIVYYKRAVESNPRFAEAVCGLFIALNSVCDWQGRGGVLLESGKFDRWHVGKDRSLLDSRARQKSSGLAKRVVDIVHHQLMEASNWGCDTLQEYEIQLLLQDLSGFCASTRTAFEDLLRTWKGMPWEGSRLVRLVERAVKVQLRRSYYARYVLGDPSAPLRSRPRLPPNLTVPSAPTVLPFHTFTCPLGPKEIRAISQRNAIRTSCSILRSQWLPKTLYPPPPPPEPQLNIGYVSSDFNNHPLAHLMQSVFGLHNPKRARAVCYATSASDKSKYREKIEQEAPLFRDVSGWPPDRLVEQIVNDQIHILVNLNGYTRGARNEIFAARPAPIHMSFMGFAGSLGAEWCDYILADTTAIPPRTLRPWRDNMSLEGVFRDDTEGDAIDWVYSENIIFCRDTFFCCDHAQSSEPGERGVTWDEEQRRRLEMRKKIFPNISTDTIILGNFNQLYKIDPTTFRSWLRILDRVPKAILWLLRFPELGEANLRATAVKWAGFEVANRMVFTEVAPKGQHIARARVCDLFLDTPECNAHTTAADVLWSSTPLLTLPRYSFKMCSRMAASILKGALPDSVEGRQAALELITGSEDEYEKTAIALANDLRYEMDHEGYCKGHGRLLEIRRLLFESKWSCALFNTRRWVDDVETAYEEAWRKWVIGESGDIYL